MKKRTSKRKLTPTSNLVNTQNTSKKKLPTTSLWKRLKKVNTIALLAGIGSLLAGIGTFIIIDKSHNEHLISIKPELVIDNQPMILIVEKNSKYHNYLMYSTVNTDMEASEAMKMEKDTFHINHEQNNNRFEWYLFNFGSGVAKNISLTWSLDTLELLSLLNHLKCNKIDTVIYNNNYFSVYTKTDTNHYKCINECPYFQILAPYSTCKDPIIGRFPYQFFTLYSLYLYLDYNKPIHIRKPGEPIKKPTISEQLALKEFPDVILNLTYNDIENNVYKEEYIIKLHTYIASGTTSPYNPRPIEKVYAYTVASFKKEAK